MGNLAIQFITILTDRYYVKFYIFILETQFVYKLSFKPCVQED